MLGARVSRLEHLSKEQAVASQCRNIVGRSRIFGASDMGGFRQIFDDGKSNFLALSKRHVESSNSIAFILLGMELTTVAIFLASLFTSLMQALPSAALYHPLAKPSNSTLDDITPFCFDTESHPGIRVTNAPDCHRALGLLIRQPGFTTPYKFSKNPRRLDVISLPKGWGADLCVIFISCANAQDTGIFRYADVAREARKVIRNCVDNQPEPYGGLYQVGSEGTFYVSVGRPTDPRPRPPGLVEIASAANVSAY